MIFNNWPYSDAYTLNLDWLLEQTKKNTELTEEATKLYKHLTAVAQIGDTVGVTVGTNDLGGYELRFTLPEGGGGSLEVPPVKVHNTASVIGSSSATNEFYSISDQVEANNAVLLIDGSTGAVYFFDSITDNSCTFHSITTAGGKYYVAAYTLSPLGTAWIYSRNELAKQSDIAAISDLAEDASETATTALANANNALTNANNALTKAGNATTSAQQAGTAAQQAYDKASTNEEAIQTTNTAVSAIDDRVTALENSQSSGAAIPNGSYTMQFVASGFITGSSRSVQAFVPGNFANKRVTVSWDDDSALHTFRCYTGYACPISAHVNTTMTNAEMNANCTVTATSCTAIGLYLNITAADKFYRQSTAQTIDNNIPFVYRTSSITFNVADDTASTSNLLTSSYYGGLASMPAVGATGDLLED